MAKPDPMNWRLTPDPTVMVSENAHSKRIMEADQDPLKIEKHVLPGAMPSSSCIQELEWIESRCSEFDGFI